MLKQPASASIVEMLGGKLLEGPREAVEDGIIIKGWGVRRDNERRLAAWEREHSS